jgi:hypothetical protein
VGGFGGKIGPEDQEELMDSLSRRALQSCSRRVADYKRPC